MNRRLSVLALLMPLLSAAYWWMPRGGQAQPQTRSYHFVRGTIVAVVQGAGIDRASHIAMREIALPGARVYLVKTSDLNRPLTSNISDLSGRFGLKTLEEGVFTVCAEAEGFPRQCQSKEFRFGALSQSLGKVRLFPEKGRDIVTVFGTLSLRDGDTARVFAPHMGLNAFPRVNLDMGSAFRRTAYVNNFGEYVIAGVPLSADFRLVAEVENERQELRIGTLQGVPPNTSQRYDFALPNSAPRLRAMAAQVAGQRVQAVAPGTLVTFRAAVDDPDSDQLTYRWILPDGSMAGPFPQPVVDWTAPSRRGTYTAAVLVTDNRGGVIRSSHTLTVTSGGVSFSGTVVDTSGASVTGAQVEVNGRLTNTNTRGAFNLEVPVRDKYVLTIRKSGLDAGAQPAYGTLSFVYANAIAGGRWTLRPAEVVTVDPTQPIRIQHRRTEKDCFGSAGDGIAWNDYLQPGIIDWQDGRGNSVRIEQLARRTPDSVLGVQLLLSRLNPALARVLGARAKVGSQVDDRKLPCGPGIQVEIPPNSLEDSSGRAPTGMVNVSLSTVDLNVADSMPGDYSVFDPTGKAIGMESFGAGGVEIGAAGRRYNLKAGATATVTIPVDGTQLAGNAALPPTMPFLYYDERNGVWRQDGDAQLVGSGATAAYVKTVRHFSTMNADILKSGQSCLAVEVDPGAGFTLPFNVEVTLPPSVVNPTVIQRRILAVDSQKSNAIYNLPNNTNVVLVPVIAGVRPDGSTGNVPAGVFVVNSGGPQLSATNPPTPNADGTYYAEAGGVPTGPCASRVTLTNLATPTIDPLFEFLQGLYFESSNITELELSAPAVADAIKQGAEDYYNLADPREGRLSFNLFKSKNRFGQALGLNEVEFDAQYANSGDLGFGRDMHCRRNVGTDGAFDIACYVTNFGQPPTNLPDQTDADNTLNGTTPDATVAMEYSRVENAAADPIEFPDNDRAVKFYVYNTNQPDADRLIKADLDGFGERPVPQLCMICHGGQAASEAADPTNPSGPKRGSFQLRSDITSMNSQFLPFDLHFFKFPAAKPNQQTAFRNLNIEIVRPVAQAMGPLGAPTTEVIDAWYPGGVGDQVDAAVIANWDAANPSSDDHRFYRDVFARACRTCHITVPFSAPPSAYTNKVDFRNDITNVQTRVCSQRVMPHALRTNLLFWTSLTPSMPAFLQLYGQTLPGWSAGPQDQCGTFQAGGNIPSVFDSEIYPILANRCSGGACHSPIGNANWHVGGGAAAAYTELLTAVTSGGNYIVPFNPGASVLFQRISQANPGRMPLGGPDLATVDLDGDGVNDRAEIENWINLGAPQ